MRVWAAITQRELLALFCSPIGYVVVAGYWLVIGVMALMQSTFMPGALATLRDIFIWSPFILAIVVPAMTMRTLAEEYRSGTFEALMTAPVTDGQVVFGKYFAALLFYLFMLAGTLPLPILMQVFGELDWGETLALYLGLLLLGCLYVACSVFASSLTRDQAVAWILSAIPLMLIVFGAQYFVSTTEGHLREALRHLDIMGRFALFARGQLPTDGVVFFLALALLFLFLTVKVVESRRWR